MTSLSSSPSLSDLKMYGSPLRDTDDVFLLAPVAEGATAEQGSQMSVVNPTFSPHCVESEVDTLAQSSHFYRIITEESLM